MDSDFIKMAAQPPMMSTPIKGKYSSLFQEIALLPYRLFGRCSRDSSELLKMDSPKSGSSPPPGISMSPCRHSLRLLANGYYICDEDSFCWDDLGNVSFSPTQCTVSYKENMVRIFRKRRRTLVQRRLDLLSHGYPDDMQPPYYEDLNDIEPLVVEPIYSSGFDDSENMNLYASPPESDTDRASSGYSWLMDDEKFMKILHQPINSMKNVEKLPTHIVPGAPHKVNNENPDPRTPSGHYPPLGAQDELRRHSCGGYLRGNNDDSSCGFSHDFHSLGPKERLVVKRPSADSIATTLTPSIGSDAQGADDSRQRRLMILLVFVTVLLLCLILWWHRSPDNISIRTRIRQGI